jgi:Tfp pilus assembly protein PilV
MNQRGFGTIEAVVAASLFAMIAAALASTLTLCRRLQTRVDAERGAVLLAAAHLERLRAGSGGALDEAAGRYTVSSGTRPWAGNGLLLEAHARVTWQDGGEQQVELWTLMQR